jgi:hydrogenase maturation factor HypF (carbamoyltransferase family)
MHDDQLKPLIAKCEKCGIENETVNPNFLLYGFMVCESCKISDTLFPV